MKTPLKQNMMNYTDEDRLVWKTLFERQVINLQNKVCTEYMQALNEMSAVLHAKNIPDFEEIDHWFESRTGWKIEVVPGLIPVDEFFELLAQKRFCSSTWLRSMHQLDYLEEPDMFHDTFGHIPLLSNPIFSSFMQEFGLLGMAMKNHPEIVIQLQRLYWFTIEFGLIGIYNPLIYGAGIISSFGESNRATSKQVSTFQFELNSVLEHTFQTDAIQEDYCTISSFEALFDSIIHLKNKLICTVGVQHPMV